MFIDPSTVGEDILMTAEDGNNSAEIIDTTVSGNLVMDADNGTTGSNTAILTRSDVGAGGGNAIDMDAADNNTLTFVGNDAPLSAINGNIDMDAVNGYNAASISFADMNGDVSLLAAGNNTLLFTDSSFIGDIRVESTGGTNDVDVTLDSATIGSVLVIGDGTVDVSLSNGSIATGITTGISDDNISLTGENVTGNISTNDGDDAVSVDGTTVDGSIISGEGLHDIDVTNSSTVTGNITTGNGNATIDVIDSVVGVLDTSGDITTVDGDDIITITDSIVYGSISTGDGDDTIVIDPSLVHNSISTGIGNDSVEISGSVVGDAVNLDGDITMGIDNDNNTGTNALSISAIEDYAATVYGDVAMFSDTSNTVSIEGEVILNLAYNAIDAVYAASIGTVNSTGIVLTAGNLSMSALVYDGDAITQVGTNVLTMGEVSHIAGVVSMDAGLSNTMTVDSGWIYDYSGGPLAGYEYLQSYVTSIDMAGHSNLLNIAGGTLAVTEDTTVAITMGQLSLHEGGDNTITIADDGRMRVDNGIVMGSIVDPLGVYAYEFTGISWLGGLEVNDFDWTTATIYDTATNTVTIDGKMYVGYVGTGDFVLSGQSNTIEVTGPATTNAFGVDPADYSETTAIMSCANDVYLNGQNNSIKVGINPLSPLADGEAEWQSNNVVMQGWNVFDGSVAAETNELLVADAALFTSEGIGMLATDSNTLDISGIVGTRSLATSINMIATDGYNDLTLDYVDIDDTTGGTGNIDMTSTNGNNDAVIHDSIIDGTITQNATNGSNSLYIDPSAVYGDILQIATDGYNTTDIIDSTIVGTVAMSVNGGSAYTNTLNLDVDSLISSDIVINGGGYYGSANAINIYGDVSGSITASSGDDDIYIGSSASVSGSINTGSSYSSDTLTIDRSYFNLSESSWTGDMLINGDVDEIFHSGGTFGDYGDNTTISTTGTVDFIFDHNSSLATAVEGNIYTSTTNFTFNITGMIGGLTFIDATYLQNWDILDNGADGGNFDIDYFGGGLTDGQSLVLINEYDYLPGDLSGWNAASITLDLDAGIGGQITLSKSGGVYTGTSGSDTWTLSASGDDVILSLVVVP